MVFHLLPPPLVVINGEYSIFCLFLITLILLHSAEPCQAPFSSSGAWKTTAPSHDLHREEEDGVVEGQRGRGTAGDGDADAHDVSQVQVLSHEGVN